MKNITYLPVYQEDLGIIKTLSPQGWGDITPAFEFYLQKSYCVPIKAILDGEIAGIGTVILFPQTCWLAHIIVSEQFRNKGIGTGIVSELLKIIESHAIPTCLLIATEFGFPVYKKLGFRTVCEYSFLERRQDFADNSFSKNIVPCTSKYHSNIANLDQKIAGEDRWVLLSDYLENALVYLNENDVLEGYYLPNWGEGLIGADTPKAGLELLKIKCFNTKNLVIPSPNLAAIEFAKKAGFELQAKTGIRMIWGKDTGFEAEKVFSRIAGKLG